MDSIRKPTQFETPSGGGWELLPGITVGDHSLIDAISIMAERADYLLEVATARQNDGSILWFIRGYVDEFYVPRIELNQDLYQACEILDNLEADYDCGMGE